MDAKEVRERAEQIAEQADDVRRKTQDLVLDVVRSGEQAVRGLPAAVEEVIEGASEGLREIAENKRAEVLKEVLDGISDGVSKTAEAFRLALEEASGRGRQFADDEVRGTVEDLKTIASLLGDRLEQFARNAARTMDEQVQDLASHARRAASDARPAIESAIDAARAHPLDLGRDAAKVAGEAARLGVGSLLSAIGGALDGLGKALRDEQAGEGEKAGSSKPEDEGER